MTTKLPPPAQPVRRWRVLWRSNRSKRSRSFEHLEHAQKLEEELKASGRFSNIWLQDRWKK